MKSKPLVLLTNDDGIDSPWVQLLARHLAEVAEVVLSAPASEQSAVGNSITLNEILRVHDQGHGRYAVSGTPTDAVLLAMSEFCPRPPALVVSGINPGPNLGTDVFYSGTVAGAIQASIRGIQGMAVSQELPESKMPGGALQELFENTARFATFVARQLLDSPLPPNTTLNLNAPASLASCYAWTAMGKRVYREGVERHLDPRGRPYYWVGGPPIRNINPPGTDGHAVEAGLFSLTLLDLNLTADAARRPVGSWAAGEQAWVETEDVENDSDAGSRL